ncbi:MAG TPA: hypothetical protein PK765_00975 [bacterium]|nr:hypothetical protein [bacterium]
MHHTVYGLTVKRIRHDPLTLETAREAAENRFVPSSFKTHKPLIFVWTDFRCARAWPESFSKRGDVVGCGQVFEQRVPPSLVIDTHANGIAGLVGVHSFVCLRIDNAVEFVSDLEEYAIEV